MIYNNVINLIFRDYIVVNKLNAIYHYSFFFNPPPQMHQSELLLYYLLPLLLYSIGCWPFVWSPLQLQLLVILNLYKTKCYTVVLEYQSKIIKKNEKRLLYQFKSAKELIEIRKR